MNEITQTISQVKSVISESEWQRKIEACRQSGLPIGEWCEQNGVTPGQYYYHLRKIRKSIIEDQKIIPVSVPASRLAEGITIQTESFTVKVPEGICQENLLKLSSSCLPGLY